MKNHEPRHHVQASGRLARVTNDDQSKRKQNFIDEALEKKRKRRKREIHNAQTRKSRRKSKNLLSELVLQLPKPPGNTNIKTKKAKLEYAASCCQSLQAELACLESKLVFTSRKCLIEWITDVAARSSSVDTAVLSLAGLLCASSNAIGAHIWHPLQARIQFESINVAVQFMGQYWTPFCCTKYGLKHPLPVITNRSQILQMEQLIGEAPLNFQPIASRNRVLYRKLLGIPISLFGEAVRFVTFSTEDGQTVDFQLEGKWVSQECRDAIDFVNMLTIGLTNELQNIIARSSVKEKLPVKDAMAEFCDSELRKKKPNNKRPYKKAPKGNGGPKDL